MPYDISNITSEKLRKSYEYVLNKDDIALKDGFKDMAYHSAMCARAAANVVFMADHEMKVIPCEPTPDVLAEMTATITDAPSPRIAAIFSYVDATKDALPLLPKI